MLATYRRAGKGVQLAWRDGGGEWHTATSGAVSDGLLHNQADSLLASIAVERDTSGAERAWVVISDPNSSRARPLVLRRLSNLDAAGGPSVGPLVTLDAPAGGAYRGDVAFERPPGGDARGVVVWSRKAADGNFELVVGWLSDLGTDTPSLTSSAVLVRGPGEGRYATLSQTAGGVRVVALGVGARLSVWSHVAGSPLGSWVAAATGPRVGGASSPSAVTLDGGDTIGAADGDVAGTVELHRFNAAGANAPELELAGGYQQPTLATDGVRAWVFMVRTSDGRLVSRERSGGGTWTDSDRVEIDAGQNPSWPNALRTADERLALIVRGPALSTTASVQHWQRAP